MGDDAASRIGWGVVLGGEAFDLEDWREALKQPFQPSDPWVSETKDGLILRSSLLDSAATASKAYERAKALMDEVNGAIRASCGAGVVRLEGIAEIFSDGTRQRHVFGQISVIEPPDKVRFMGVAVGPDGKPIPPPPPQPSEVQRWLRLAAEDVLLADALTYFARGDDWFDVYKALECLFARSGGERKFLALGWADDDKIKLLKQTADVERHSRRGRPGVVPPPQPMERTEARDLLATLVARAFLEAPAAPTPSPERSKGGRKARAVTGASR